MTQSDTELHVLGSHQLVLAPGEILFEEGDDGDELYVIQSGEIELSREGPAGRRPVARLGPGEFFGELSVVEGTRRSARARAICETRLLRLDGETVEAMVLSQPEIAVRVIRGLARRLVEAEQRDATVGVAELIEPVVRALVRRAEPDAAHGSRIPLTLRTLAEEAGLSMRQAHRALHQLFDRRLLQLTGDRLVAPDLERLSACLDTVAD